MKKITLILVCLLVFVIIHILIFHQGIPSWILMVQNMSTINLTVDYETELSSQDEIQAEYTDMIDVKNEEIINNTASLTNTERYDGIIMYHNTTLPDHYKSLFYKADLRPLIDQAKQGGPFNYIPEYRNPCWWAGTATNNITYTKVNDHKQTTHSNRHMREDNWRLQCFPFVYNAGITKSGTTDLFETMRKHPHIITSPKEPLFWTTSRFNSYAISYPRVLTLQEYVDAFKVSAENIQGNMKKILIDASSNTVFNLDGWRDVPGNDDWHEPKYTVAMTIKALTPSARIILILRNPTERLYSHYRMICKHTNLTDISPDKFHEDVVRFIQMMEVCLQHQTIRGCAYNYTYFRINLSKTHIMGTSILRASLYHVFVKDWLEVFPRHQIHIVKAEDYYSNRSTHIKIIYQFLGLDPYLITDEQYRNMDVSRPVNRDNSYYPQMLNATRLLLETFLSPHNEMLAQLLGDQRFIW